MPKLPSTACTSAAVYGVHSRWYSQYAGWITLLKDP